MPSVWILLRFNRYTEGERDEQTELVRSVMAADIERVGSASAKPLALGLGRERRRTPCPASAIVVRIELQVPLTIPYTAR